MEHHFKIAISKNYQKLNVDLPKVRIKKRNCNKNISDVVDHFRNAQTTRTVYSDVFAPNFSTFPPRSLKIGSYLDDKDFYFYNQLSFYVI